MSFRVFEGEEHAALYRKFREKPPTALIQRVLQYLREEVKGPLRQALDLGCGSGQCTFLLAPHFEKVLGTDISQSQIGEALKGAQELGLNNVEFRVCGAENVEGFEPGSVELITSCTAAHWFDLPKVYEQGRRLLCPGGVMAFFTVGIGTFSVNGEGKEAENKAIEEYINNELLKSLSPYFEKPAGLALNRYKDVVIPYRDFVREDGYESCMPGSMNSVLGRIKSYSGFQTLCSQKGAAAGDNFIQSVQKRLMELANLSEEDLDAEILTLRNKYCLVMARI